MIDQIDGGNGNKEIYFQPEAKSIVHQFGERFGSYFRQEGHTITLNGFMYLSYN